MALSSFWGALYLSPKMLGVPLVPVVRDQIKAGAVAIKAMEQVIEFP
jgi:hypothetical protein